MASEIFIDSGAFYAMLDPNEHWHKEVKRQIESLIGEKARFVTSDYVLDETITLLQSRGLSYLVEHWIEDVIFGNSCEIVWMDRQKFDVVRQFFTKHSDKQWSFTDCFSFCVMKERKIRRALAADKHFKQAGFQLLLND
ncbi:MAG: PIN domain-containing protein [Bythopirellula sp.]|nr:PIN domain-containing protein [Bythopirellula sp.]